MFTLDTNVLVQRLEARYGLSLSGGEQEVDGGKFFAIRPNDLARPNGFSIIVARTPRLLEATVLFDGFTRGLLRQISEADDYQRFNFAKTAEEAISKSFRIRCSINGVLVKDFLDLPREEWTKVEIDCDFRLQIGKNSSIHANNIALEVTSVCLSLILCLLPIEEITESVLGVERGLPEGARMKLEVNRYERSPINRAACIAHHGNNCLVCGLDFCKRYGLLGRDYIEVHHRIPVSEMGGSYRVDPINDLVPVCANCHAMLHRANPPLSIEALKTIIDASANRD